MITGALSFDSNSVINISGVLDLAYNTFSDTGAAYADGLGLILERLTFTEIAWLNTSLSNIFNLSTNALLGNKYAFVNSTEVAGLNQSANITFFGINFIYPYPKVDFEDDGTFITCPGGVCTEISYVGTTYLFNVTRFTNYTLGDNYTYPNQTTPILNSSLGTDTTNENLTVYPQNVTGAVNATLTNITDWFVNNKSLMVLKMPFNTNDSSNAKDYSPFQNNGTIINTASWTTAGISGGAYLFNGVNDYINVSDDPTLNFGNGSYSLEAWFNASAVSPSDQWIITKYDGIFGFGLFINVVSGAPGNISFTADGTAGNVFFSTNGTDYRDNLWHHVVATYNPLNGSMIYVDGVLQASNATYVGYTNNTVALEIGAGGGGGGPFNGTIDEVRIYNRSLTAQQVAANYNSGSPDYNTIVSQETVVNETWRACVVINDGLFDSAELCSNNLTILGPGVGNTSLLGVKFNVSDFSFASTNYVTGILDFFNTSAANTTVVLMSSMNIKKLNIPGQQNNVYTRVKVDGSTVLEELLRSVQGMDEGSTGTKPVKFSLGPGSHNITFEFRRTNRGSIEINDIDVLLGQLMTAAGNPVGSQLVNGVYSHSANNFVPAFNWTINKTVNSSTVIVTKQTLNASGTATADYYFEDLGAGVVSPYWSRWLQSVNDVGSVSGNFIEEKETLVHNHTIQSRTSANTVTVNFTILDFDLRDSSASLVNSFSATDN